MYYEYRHFDLVNLTQRPLRLTFFTPSDNIFSISSLCFEKLSTRLSLVHVSFSHLLESSEIIYIPHLGIVFVLLLAVPCPVGNSEHSRALHHECDCALGDLHLGRWLCAGSLELMGC